MCVSEQAHVYMMQLFIQVINLQRANLTAQLFVHWTTGPDREATRDDQL